MQNAVIGMIVGASFLGLTLVALRSRRGGSAIGLQIMLGVIVGTLTAAIAVSIRADLVPDSIEAVVAVAVVMVAAIGLIVIVARHQSG